MKLEIEIPEHHYNNIMALDSVSLGRVPYKGIIMYSINAIKHGKVLEQEPTTKNDMVTLTFPKGTLKYSCKDYVVYKRDWLRSHYGAEIDIMFGDSKYKEPTTKNDLGVDCISRADAIRVASGYCHPSNVAKELAKLPSVTPPEPKTGYWISTETKGVRYAFWCRYKCSLCGGLSDHTNFCPNCGCRMVEPQESED